MEQHDTFVYLRIAGEIERAIRDGEIPPGGPVPSEKQLRDATGAGRNAVRMAVAHLRDRGVVYTVAHLGSFACRDIPPPGPPARS
jgi:DNA-binding GntR family transcriptional regulator